MLSKNDSQVAGYADGIDFELNGFVLIIFYGVEDV
jgi:hypothetical protein